jgi:hypothetical protein
MRPLRTLAVLALALAPVFSGCGDDKDLKKPAIEWALPPAAAAAKAAPIEDFVPPASIIAWGGADSVEKLAGGVQAFLAQVSPLLPNVLDLAKDELRRKLVLTRLDGIDWKAPARVAVFDAKANPKASFALIVGLADKAAFLKTLPPSKKENDEGNAISYRDDLGRYVYLSFIDGSVCITWDKKQFPVEAAHLVTLTRASVAQKQALFLSTKNMAALYAKDIDELQEQGKQQMIAMPGVQSEAGGRVLSWMIETFRELDRIEALPALLEDGALLSLRLHPKADTALQKSFKAIVAHPHTLLAKIPADSTMFASFSTDPEAADGLTTRLVEWVLTMGFGGKVPDGYAEAMRDYFKATSGEMAIAAHKPVSGDGLTLTALLSVRDEAKLREAMRKSKQPYKDKAMLESFKKVGVKVDYREAAYKVGPSPVDILEVSFEKGKNPLAQFGPFGEAMSELSTHHTAVSKDLALIGYGKEARKSVEAFLNGKVSGGLDKAAGPARAFRLGVKDPVGLLYISPVEMAKRASIGGKNPFAESLKDLAGTSGVALSFTAKDGIFEIVLDVPVEQAKNVAQAAQRTRGLFPQ